MCAWGDQYYPIMIEKSNRYYHIVCKRHSLKTKLKDHIDMGYYIYDVCNYPFILTMLREIIAERNETRTHI